MAHPGLTFSTHVMQPRPGMKDERKPEYKLPEPLLGFERSKKTMLVTAVRDSDQAVVGMGGGWILTHPDRPDALLVQAAEVNGPYLNTGLERRLIEVLTQSATEQGIAQIFVDSRLQQWLADKTS
jgi:hypothetical protein